MFKKITLGLTLLLCLNTGVFADVISTGTSGGGTTNAGRVIYSWFGSSGTPASLVETSLSSYVLEGNRLKEDGASIRVTLRAVAASNANTKSLFFKFGSSSSLVNNSSTAPNGSGIAAEYIIQRTGASSQLITRPSAVVSTSVQNPSVTTSEIVGSENLSSDITISITGLNTVAAANELILKSVVIELLPLGSTTSGPGFSGGILSSPIQLSDGLVSAPSLTMANDTTDGWYRQSADTWSFAVNAAERMRLAPVSSGLTLQINSPSNGSAFLQTGLGSTFDTGVNRLAANSLGMRPVSAVTPIWSIANLWTDSSNYELMSFKFVSNVAVFGTESAGSGTPRNLKISSGGATTIYLTTNSTDRFAVNASGLLPQTDNSLDAGSATARLKHTYTGRIVTGAATPTIAGTTGLGTGGAVSLNSGASDLGGGIALSTGSASTGSSGSVTITFSTSNGAYGTNTPRCTATLFNATGAWNARATVIGSAASNTTVTLNWDNNGVNLTTSVVYAIHYHCLGT